MEYHFRIVRLSGRIKAITRRSVFCRYPTCRAASNTRAAVSGCTCARRFNARDTVETSTPASSAICRIPDSLFFRMETSPLSG